MFCSNCGNKLDNNAKFCSNCGAPVGQSPTVQPAPIQSTPIPEMPYYPMTENGVTFNAFEIAYNTNLFEKTGFLKTQDTADEIMRVTNLGSFKASFAAQKMLEDSKLKIAIEEYKKGKPVVFNVQVNANDDQLRCPNCNSNQIEVDKQGFSGGKALVGGLLTGGIGLVAGFHNKNKRKGKCLKCGHSWTI